MRAEGNPDEADAGSGEDDGPGLWASAGAALRLIVGWFSVAIGLLNLLVEADRSTGGSDLPYVLFHAVLILGGAALLGTPWLDRGPGTAGRLLGGGVAVAGMVITAVPVRNTVCCLSALDVRHGFPFSFLGRDDGEGWHLDGPHLVADLLFWAFLGLLVLTVAAMARRLWPRRAAPPRRRRCRRRGGTPTRRHGHTPPRPGARSNPPTTDVRTVGALP